MSQSRLLPAPIAQRKKAKSRRGVLARTILIPLVENPPEPGLFFKEDDLQTAKELRAARLPLVFEQYGISPDATDAKDQLLWKLLETYETGMQFRFAKLKKSGAKPKWQGGEELKLFRDAQALMAQGHDLASAMSKLKRDQGHLASVPSLKNHYWAGLRQAQQIERTKTTFPEFARLLGLASGRE